MAKPRIPQQIPFLFQFPNPAANPREELGWKIAAPEPFRLPEEGEIAHGRVATGGYIHNAFIWPSAESPGLHHVMAYLDCPPGEQAAGMLSTWGGLKRPVLLAGSLGMETLDRILEFDHRTAAWEVIDRDPAPLEQIRAEHLSRPAGAA